jgi:hypothetical protein
MVADGGPAVFTPEGGASDAGGLVGNDEGSAPVCAAVSSAARSFIDVQFLFDRSASMSSAWPAVSAAVNAFIGDSSVVPNTLGWTGTYFPDGDTSTECTSYDGGGFGGDVPFTWTDPSYAFDYQFPPPAGGVKDMAEAVRYWLERDALVFDPEGGSAGTGQPLLFVLVTDGQALGCSESMADVTGEVTKWAPYIPTFVAAVGTPPAPLDALAQAGGTNAALSIDPTNPQSFASTLLTAIGPFDCSYRMPSPPDGGTLDLMKVNVVYTPTSGKPETLDYNPTCGGNGTGWRFNDPNDALFLELCHASCAAASATGVTANVAITVGCPTQVAQ